MDLKRKMKKGNLIVKTWERCKSIGRGSKSSSGSIVRAMNTKSKSWPRVDVSSSFDRDISDRKRSLKRHQVAPHGCFSVYVGPQKQRFVIKTEYANHPLFKMLLDEAESEYGYTCEGPLSLPCNVDYFCKVLLAMDDDGEDREFRRGCGFPRSPASYLLLSPSPLIAINQF
ncbi:auxin-responsive protein SAUR32-like [Tripterygium wilfordii]|uniref:auxin-responsive protein SAUR32-like n=1 Tax=Tripterygium wilfordii TaxID=458696 RepID=UPI0018F7F1E9|nr:auxin-responsive protein SAUR32-like [Tripterygium wilfordii]